MTIDLFSIDARSLPFELPNGPGYRAVWNKTREGFEINVPDGELFFAPDYFDKRVSDRAVEVFQENNTVDWRTCNFKELSEREFEEIQFTNIKWKQDHIRLYGKVHPLPRVTAWYGDSGKAYTYSGITSVPNEWNKALTFFRDRVERCALAKFNSVLLNWYRDGSDHLSWHADDEKELGENPVIASVNFGATRGFLLRRKDDEKAKLAIPLSHGSLLVMGGELQKFWQHSVPKRSKVQGSRFNLTFRRVGLA